VYLIINELELQCAVERHLSDECQMVHDVSRRLRSSGKFTSAMPLAKNGWMSGPLLLYQS